MSGPTDMSALRRLALLAVIGFGLLAIECGGATPRPATSAGTPVTLPVVYLLMSSALCRDGRADDISRQVAADRAGLLQVFPKAIVLNTETFDPETTPGATTKDQPVLFFYSGHGVARTAGDGTKESHLCLPKREIPFHELARWVRKRGDGASLLVLNACESAYVDPSVEELGPMAVVSASMDATMNAAPDRSGAGTPLAAVLVSLLDGKGIESTDGNCDGVVTDQELFDALENELREYSWKALIRSPGNQLEVPVAKLRRNSESPLALLRLDGQATSKRCRSVLENFRAAANRIPQVAKVVRGRGADAGYFVLTEGAGELRRARACSELDGELAMVCRTLQVELTLLEVPEAARVADLAALARVHGAGQIYEARVDAPWVELVKLRDGLTTAVTMVPELATAVPARRRTLHRALDGSVRRLYTARVCPTRLAPFEPRAIPCPGSSGQCFQLNREPVGLEDACQ